MSSSVGLHSRRRPSIRDDEENPLTSTTADPVSHSNKWRKARRSIARCRNQLGWAVEATLLFLALGLFLGYFILHHQHRKVILHIMTNPLAHAGAALRGRVGFRHHFYTGHPRTVTVVMPSVVAPDQRNRRLDSIFETWGPAARAVYVVHNVSESPQAASHAVLSDTLRPQDPYSYPQLLLVPPSIGFDDGWPRLMYVIRQVYERINPDFAYLVNDHSYVIPEHLCKYLETQHPSQDMYHGHALKNGQDVFNSGASGYILSRRTMERLVHTWDEGNPVCTLQDDGSQQVKWLQNNPNLVTTKCLKEVLGISPVDTRQHGKYHRFHAFPLTRVVSGDVDGWYRNRHQDMDQKLPGTDPSYSTLLQGADCCATDSVSFHYVEYKESRALFAVREKLLKHPTMKDAELKSLVRKEWPTSGKEIGGYSRGLPQETDEEGWKQLLLTLRKISNRHTQREC